MNLWGALIAVVAGTLPRRLRGRYRQEWLADLGHAAELGISRWAVIIGAVSLAVHLDRDHVAVTGVPPVVATIRRARWSAAFLSGALILGFGGYGLPLDGFGPLLRGLVPVFVLIGVSRGVAALRVGYPVYGASQVAWRILQGAAMAVTLTAIAIFPFAGTLTALAIMSVMLPRAAGATAGQPPRRPLPLRSQVMLGATLGALSLVVVALGAAHILVWNPLAKLPGTGLGEIYAALAAAGQPNGIVQVAVWAGIFVVLALAFPVGCALGRFDGPGSSRRIVVVGMMMVAFAAQTQGFAGMTTAMSLADTFGVSGGDAATSGPVLAALALVALTIAVFAAFAPARWQETRPIPAG